MIDVDICDVDFENYILYNVNLKQNNIIKRQFVLKCVRSTIEVNPACYFSKQGGHKMLM